MQYTSKHFYGLLYCKRQCCVKIVVWIDRLIDNFYSIACLAVQGFVIIMLESATNLLKKDKVFHITNNMVFNYFHLKTDFLVKKRISVEILASLV